MTIRGQAPSRKGPSIWTPRVQMISGGFFLAAGIASVALAVAGRWDSDWILGLISIGIGASQIGMAVERTRRADHAADHQS
jgi:hypothetical protein